MSGKQWLASIAGFVGVIIAIAPIDLIQTAGDWRGYAAAFAAMLCVTVQMLTLRVLGEKESRECMAFYPRLGPAIGGFTLMVFLGAAPMPFGTTLCALSAGCFGGIGWILVAQAYKLAPAGTVAPFQYFQIVVGTVMGYLIWHDVPSVHLMIGIAIIVLSGIYIVRHAGRVAPAAALPPEILP